MNLSSCGVSNDQHIPCLLKMMASISIIYSLKEGPRVSIHCFADFKSSEDKFQCWKWKKTSLYIHVFRPKKTSHHRGSTVNAKGKSVRVYWKISCREDIQWGCTRICEMTWMLTACITSMSCRDPFFSKCYL